MRLLVLCARDRLVFVTVYVHTVAQFLQSRMANVGKRGCWTADHRHVGLIQRMSAYLQFFLKAKRLLLLWINLEIYDLLPLGLRPCPSVGFNQQVVRIVFWVSVAHDVEAAKLLRWGSVTYLHVKFALHQVRQAVESTHGQHKQWKTDSRERTGSLCHVTNGICQTVYCLSYALGAGGS